VSENDTDEDATLWKPFGAACEAAVTRAEAEIEAHRDAEALAELEGELVSDALDLDRGNGGTLQRGQQHAPQAVAEGVSEAAIERLDDERAGLVADVFGCDLWNEIKHVCATPLGSYLE
jgi:hypothetical protein